MSVTLAGAIDDALKDIAKKLNAKVTDGTIGIRHLQKGSTRVNMSFLITPKSDLKSTPAPEGVFAENPRENHTAKTD